MMKPSRGLVERMLWVVLLISLVGLPFFVSAQPVLTTKYYGDPLSIDVGTTKGVDYLLSVKNNDVAIVESSLLYLQAVTFQPTAFTLLVNNEACVTPIQKTDAPPKVMTTIKFDCSNVISQPGLYSISVVPSADVASIGVWDELEYTQVQEPIEQVKSVDTIQHINNTASLTLSGTDYEVGDNAKSFLQLNLNNEPVNNASCFVKIWYPNGTVFQDYIKMDFLDEGIYYRDFTAPSIVGVYPVASKCNYLTIDSTFVPSTSNKILGGGTTTLANLGIVDGSYSQQNENGADSRFITQDYNFTGVNSTNFVDLQVYFDALRINGVADPATDNIHLWILNFSSNAFVELPITYNYSATVEAHYPSAFQPTNFSDFIKNSTLTIRVNDTLGGVNDIVTTLLDIDRLIIVISATEGNTSVNTLRGSGELNIRRHFTEVQNTLFSMSAVENDTNIMVRQINITLNTNFSTVLNSLAQINTTTNTISSLLALMNASLTTGMNNLSTQLIVLNNTLYFLQNQTLTAINATVNLTSINTQLGAIYQLQNQTNLTASQIFTIVGVISNVTDQNLQVSLDIQKNITFIRSTLQNITVSIAAVQTSINSIANNVIDLQNSMTQVKNNLTYLISLELNETNNQSFVNLTLQLTQIQASINNNTISLNQINTTTNSILSNLLIHITQENISQALELSYLQNITINLSQIQTTLNNIQINISSQNLTDLNNSLTGLIINQTSQATSLSLTSFLLIIMAVLFLLMLFLDKPLLYILAGLYTFVVSFVVMTDLGTTFSLVLTFLGICSMIIGAIKVK